MSRKSSSRNRRLFAAPVLEALEERRLLAHYYVSPSGNLMMYAATHDNDGPDHTVEMAEFSSQDGYDQDGAYRPTAVPGTYKGQPNSPLKVDGTASTPAIAQGRVELYDDVQFRRWQSDLRRRLSGS